MCYLFFFFNDPAPTEIYTLSLHDALPILVFGAGACVPPPPWEEGQDGTTAPGGVAAEQRIHTGHVGLPECGSPRSEEHTSELQSHVNLVCRLLLEKKKKNTKR